MRHHTDTKLPIVELTETELSTVSAGLQKMRLPKLTGDVGVSDGRTTVRDAHDR
jgi:hypothetical protein